jgi:hypothetical protein
MNTSPASPSKTPSHHSFQDLYGTGFRIFLIGLFFLVLFFPLMDMAFHILPIPENNEKRTLAKTPSLQRGTIHEFTRNFERYFNDHFGGRNILVWLNSYLQVKWFKVSPLKSVLVGKEGWLFYNLDKGINDYRGLAHFSPEHLEVIHRNILRKTSWLRGKRIPFLILIAPNKHTVYPEYLPDGITRVNRKTRLDQILGQLTDAEKAIFIDVRPELTTGKKDRWVYSRTDTHWNSYGAFMAYQKTMEILSKNLLNAAPRPISDFIVSINPNRGLGDLSVMLSLKGRLQDLEVNLKLKGDSPSPGKKIPKMVILHDSFIFAIKPFLEYHFKQVVLQPWGERGFDYSLIEKEKPQVVLFEITERRLDALMK